MNKTQENMVCKRLRAAPDGFWTRLQKRLARTCSSHIASCPRCQRRLAAIGRVELTLSLMRTQPHSINLLANANTAALKYLTRPLRQTSCAERLRHVVPGPGRMEQTAPLLDRLMNIAACLFVVLMVRFGMVNSLFEIKDQGQKVVEKYYAKHLDAEIFKDVFGRPGNDGNPNSELS